MIRTARNVARRAAGSLLLAASIKSRLGVCGLVALLGAVYLPISASATTYNYAGDAYTTDVDPTIYGTRMTGSVTFNQDTSNFTGIIWVSGGPVTALQLTSGTISSTLPYFDINADPTSPFFSPLYCQVGCALLPDFFEFVNGNILTWELHSATTLAFQPGVVAYDLQSLGDFSPVYGSQTFDVIQSLFPATGTTYADEIPGPIGAWSPVAETPLPAALPLFATGLGAMGLFGWRRKRKNAIAA